MRLALPTRNNSNSAHALSANHRKIEVLSLFLANAIYPVSILVLMCEEIEK